MAKKPSTHYMSIDVGGSKTLLDLFSAEGNILSQAQFPTPKDETEFLTTLFKAYSKVAGKKPIQAIAMALPGSIDKTNGIFIAGGNLPWRGVNLTQPLIDRFKTPVYIENDANLGALAEATLGAGADYHTVLYVTISTGVGSGIIIDKKIVPALSKSEGGMMVFAGKDNSYKRLEDLVSGPDFKARFGKYGWDVIDPNIWKAFARDLAAGLFNMITLINPDVVVLGGGMCVHYDAFGRALDKYVGQLNPGLYPTPPIKRAQNVEGAVSLGAYLLAKDMGNRK